VFAASAIGLPAPASADPRRGARRLGVTALVQSVLGGIGLAIAGVPFAPVC
jgi:hypothetical protein